MKNIIFALLMVFGSVSSSYAGDCVGGVCRATIQPVRKVVTVTKNIVLAPVRAVAVVAVPQNCCETVVACDSCDCANTTREVVKYQPLRRRLINRTTNISYGCE